MSTRANIILRETYKDSFGKKQSNELIFYRHSDGYPEGTLPSLNIFMDWLKKNKIRNNLSQAAGWLIVLGAMEYATIPKFKTKKTKYSKSGILDTIEMPDNEGFSWKVGAYEPTTDIHGDIKYLYEIDLTAKTLKYSEYEHESMKQFREQFNTVK